MQIKDKVIENKVNNFQREISLDLLHDFQDPDFKEAKHKERVKQSLINHGIVGAVHVWLDTTDNKIYIVDGHTRKDALIELQADGYKLQNTLPCVFLDLANKDEVAKVLLTHNTKTAKINQDALPSFLEMHEITLEEAGIEIEELHLTTYDDDLDITTLEDDTGEDDCDVEPPRIPITAKGDLYELNGHRVLCGDSTLIDDVDRLMQGERADFLFTDPPYGINMSKGFSGAGGFNGGNKPIARREYQDNWDDVRPTQECFALLLSFAEYAIIWGGNYFADILPQGQHWLVWNKNNTMPTFSDCELAWTNLGRKSVKKYDLTYNGLIGKEAERFHPTQKPVKLFQMIFDDYNFTTVVDAFLGSGSTLIAAEQTNRKCYGIELEEKYCDVIVRRWTKYMQDNNKEFTVKRNGETLQQHQLDKYLN